MRSAAEDAEVTRRLRDFDRTVLRLVELDVTVAHLADRVMMAVAIVTLPTASTRDEQR